MKLFTVKLTEEERETLEAERARLGLRSQADVIRYWIAKAPGPDLSFEEALKWKIAAELAPPLVRAEPKKTELNHKDGNPRNNTLDNLEARTAVGTIRKRVVRDGKSGAPLAVREKLVRYEGDTAIWEAMK